MIAKQLKSNVAMWLAAGLVPRASSSNVATAIGDNDTESHQLARGVNSAANKRKRRIGSDRRGALTFAMLMLLVIFILLAAWVLDWVYLVLVQRNMQQRMDLVALAGTPALLDEDLLRDAAGAPQADQSDDIDAAVAQSDNFRSLNNGAGSKLLVMKTGDVRVVPGFVADPARPTSGSFGSLAGDDTLNALKVLGQRTASSANPVARLLDGFWNAGPANVESTSVAALDNLVIGFRPTRTLPAPLAPLAISAQSWKNQRSGDTNHNGIKELIVRLASEEPSAAPANGALIGLNGTFDISRLGEQISGGVSPSDLGTSGWFGPVTSSQKLVAPGTQKTSESLAAELASRFEFVAGSVTPLRAYPLYDNFNGSAEQATLVGFVAARVIAAEVIDDRLTVTVEPAFLIHASVRTAPPDDATAPERNLYVHRLTLVR